MNKSLLISIAATIIAALLAFPYYKVIELSERILSLEKDKDYLVILFQEKLKNGRE